MGMPLSDVHTMIEKTDILYVDDEENNLYLFDLMLRSKFNVHKAGSADQALKFLDSHPEIEWIVTDWRMPGKDGLTFARETVQKYSDKKFIMLSAYIQNNEIDQALAAGVLKAYFPKPLNKDLFLEKAKELGIVLN